VTPLSPARGVRTAPPKLTSTTAARRPSKPKRQKRGRHQERQASAAASREIAAVTWSCLRLASRASARDCRRAPRAKASQMRLRAVRRPPSCSYIPWSPMTSRRGSSWPPRRERRRRRQEQRASFRSPLLRQSPPCRTEHRQDLLLPILLRPGWATRPNRGTRHDDVAASMARAAVGRASVAVIAICGGRRVGSGALGAGARITVPSPVVSEWWRAQRGPVSRILDAPIRGNAGTRRWLGR
jgi:hypothetical protein